MADKLWNKNYCKVMLANFTLFFAFYILTPLLPLYLSEHFGATKDVIGLVLSGYTIVALTMRPFSGFMVDSFPRKTVLMVCFASFSIFFAGYLAASTLLMFMVIRTLHGGPFGALTVANSTVAIDVLPSSRRTEGIGYYGLSNNLAMAIAPSIGIALYQLTHSFDFIFWLALIVALIGWGVDSTIELNNDEERRMKIIHHPSSLIQLDRFFLVNGWMLAANMVFFGFCFGVLSNYLAIYSKHVLGITGGTGVYFMLCSIGLMLSRLQGGKALRQGRLTFNAGSGMIISLVGYALFASLPLQGGDGMGLFLYYSSAILIGLGNGHMWPAFQNMTICMARNNQRGTANSTILTSWDAGMGLGILLGGIISEQFGYSSAFCTVAFVNALGVLLFFLLTKSFFLKGKLYPEVH
ncbi:MAG: MFS transporter [Prevotella sp.]|nr:MFS transporter [Prevotella sp.]